MAVTRLKRKALRNKLKVKKRKFALKHLLFKPTILSLENEKKQKENS